MVCGVTSDRSSLPKFSRRVLKNEVGKHGGIRFIRHVRAEADADVKRPIQMQINRGPELCIGSPSRLTKSAKESPCFSMPIRLAIIGTKAVGIRAAGPPTASHAKLHIFDAKILFGALCQMHHSETVQSGDGLLGVVLKILANDKDRLAITVAIWVREAMSAASEASPDSFFHKYRNSSRVYQTLYPAELTVYCPVCGL
jgi:hypothetical protein